MTEFRPFKVGEELQLKSGNAFCNGHYFLKMERWNNQVTRWGYSVRPRSWAVKLKGIKGYVQVHHLERATMTKKYVGNSDTPYISEGEQVKSDGWATSYYDIPDHVKDLDDLIAHFGLNWHMANVLKACCRYGKKEGVTKQYDLNKIKFMVEREEKHLTLPT